MSVQGIERVRRNAKRVFETIEGRMTYTAIHAILSQGGATAATMTPVDTSNLINSQYAPEIQQGRGKTTGHVGYTARYAAAVHSAPGVLEGLPRPGNRGNYWDPNAEPGFLTKGFEKIQPRVPRILREVYGV